VPQVNSVEVNSHASRRHFLQEGYFLKVRLVALLTNLSFAKAAITVPFDSLGIKLPEEVG